MGALYISYPEYKCYGEPNDEVKREFLRLAMLMNLDGYTDPSSSKPLSTRLWRSYSVEVKQLLEDIREDPRQAEVLIKDTEYLRCVIRLTAQRETVTKLEDFSTSPMQDRLGGAHRAGSPVSGIDGGLPNVFRRSCSGAL